MATPSRPMAYSTGELKLVFVGVQVYEQVVDFIEHLLGPGVFAVNFIDHHHNRKTSLQGLVQHKTCLRQRPFRGINQQNSAAGHGEGAFYLAAEICVAWGIDNVNFDVIPGDGTVLGGNGNTSRSRSICGP